MQLFKCEFYLKDTDHRQISEYQWDMTVVHEQNNIASIGRGTKRV